MIHAHQHLHQCIKLERVQALLKHARTRTDKIKRSGDDSLHRVGPLRAVPAADGHGTEELCLQSQSHPAGKMYLVPA